MAKSPKNPHSSSSCKTTRRPDHGQQERWQHGGRVFEPTDQAGILLARALDADILDRLLLLRLINEEQHGAALRLRGDYYAAGLGAHLSGSYSPVRGNFSFYGGWDERSDDEEAAYRRWHDARRAMGPQLGAVVLSVVCYEEGITPAQAGLLTGGLVKLARWYKEGGASSDKKVHEASSGHIAARAAGRGKGLGC